MGFIKWKMAGVIAFLLVGLTVFCVQQMTAQSGPAPEPPTQIAKNPGPTPVSTQQPEPVNQPQRTGSGLPALLLIGLIGYGAHAGLKALSGR